MQTKLPLSRFIQARLRQLDLTPEELGFRLGYSNPAKAVGRVNALRDGYLDNRKSRAALLRLAGALEVPECEVARFIELTRVSLGERKRIANEQKQRKSHTKEVARRAEFKPHAVIVTERNVASQITFCALAGGPGTLLIVPFDLSQPPLTFVGQAVAGWPRKAPVGANGRRYVPFFGEPLGLIINYSPDRALRCNLEGNPVEWLSAAYRVGQIDLTLGGRKRSHRTVAHVLGIKRQN
jgi:hypothetical protein